jgi:hypothetical protein
MNKFFKLRVTSDFLVNSLCAITIGAGFTELTANVFLNKLYVQVCKEATKYVLNVLILNILLV